VNVEQRELARHALGLPNDRRRSYRNRYYVAPGAPAWWSWRALVDAGLALFEAGPACRGSDLFMLTRTGAEAALAPSESLDLEDFPVD